jgi:hypothetical protein
MKKLLIVVAVFVFILMLTEWANNQPPEGMQGAAFALKAQQVVQCSPTEITLVDNHRRPTHLEKDAETWPDCSVFQKDDVLDFYLTRGEKTHFVSYEKTTWWRKAL